MKVMRLKGISLTALYLWFQVFSNLSLGLWYMTGIIKGIVAVMAAMWPVRRNKPYVCNLECDGRWFLQFFLILIALTSARRFKVNEFTAIAIAGALVYPDIATLVTALQKAGQGHVLGVIPFALPAGGYLSTVMPSILAFGWLHTFKNSLRKITQMSLKSS